MSPRKSGLPPANHYGLPYSDHERALHELVVPREQSPSVFHTVGSFAAEHGLDALFNV